MNIKDCIIIKEDRKTLSLTVNKQLKVVVKMPKSYNLKKVETFINSHLNFIETQKNRIIEENIFFEKFSNEELKNKQKK